MDGVSSLESIATTGRSRLGSACRGSVLAYLLRAPLPELRLGLSGGADRRCGWCTIGPGHGRRKSCRQWFSAPATTAAALVLRRWTELDPGLRRLPRHRRADRGLLSRPVSSWLLGQCAADRTPVRIVLEHAAECRGFQFWLAGRRRRLRS